jgi:hypothetical protein
MKQMTGRGKFFLGGGGSKLRKFGGDDGRFYFYDGVGRPDFGPPSGGYGGGGHPYGGHAGDFYPLHHPLSLLPHPLTPGSFSMSNSSGMPPGVGEAQLSFLLVIRLLVGS